ncbi:MAG TPA: cytochrome c [Pyrinomonadaceae bacterium]|jgi:mono/diheme cytochrome c family protein
MNRRVKYVTFLIALLLTVGSVLGVTLAASAAQGKKSGRKGAAKIEAVYQQHCTRCHGVDGRGETNLGKIYNTPNLTEAALHARFSDKELSMIITNGQGGMPGFKKNLSKAEISALVTYVRRFRK